MVLQGSQVQFHSAKQIANSGILHSAAAAACAKQKKSKIIVHIYIYSYIYNIIHIIHEDG
jgi:hypothetical protein